MYFTVEVVESIDISPASLEMLSPPRRRMASFYRETATFMTPWAVTIHDFFVARLRNSKGVCIVEASQCRFEWRYFLAIPTVCPSDIVSLQMISPPCVSLPSCYAVGHGVFIGL